MDNDLPFFTRRFEEDQELIYPAAHSKVFYTKGGTPYLKEPGVVLIAQTATYLKGLEEFLNGFSSILEFGSYLDDPDTLDSAAQLVKFAGQTCYMSFGPKRTWNRDGDKYLNNLIASGHGSVLEHATFSFLLYGTDRAFTHELIRHRAGMAYSQESQRYVGGGVLRFVERPEFQFSPELHQKFEGRIDKVAREYEEITSDLVHMQEQGLDIVISEYSTDKRKKIQQAARAVLTNETEAIIVATGNLRAWRHIITMRANEHAEIQIRRPVFKIFQCLRQVIPSGVADFQVISLKDGTHSVHTDYPKV